MRAVVAFDNAATLLDSQLFSASPAAVLQLYKNSLNTLPTMHCAVLTEWCHVPILFCTNNHSMDWWEFPACTLFQNKEKDKSYNLFDLQVKPRLTAASALTLHCRYHVATAAYRALHLFSVYCTSIRPPNCYAFPPTCFISCCCVRNMNQQVLKKGAFVSQRCGVMTTMFTLDVAECTCKNLRYTFKYCYAFNKTHCC